MNATSQPTEVHRNPWFTITHDSRPDGSNWFRLIAPDSAMVVPVDQDGSLFVIRGTRDTTGATPLYEFPCGAIDAGESPEAAAARELHEESGIVAASLEPIGSFFAAPGFSPVRTYVFLATGLDRGESALEPGEDWTVERHTAHSIDDLVRRDAMVDAGSIAALTMARVRRRLD